MALTAWERGLRPIVTPFAVLASLANVVAAAFTAGGLHAVAHAALAAVFALWAQRLTHNAPDRPEPAEARQREPRLELLEAEVSHLQGELTETLQRLEFAEKMMMEKVDARRFEPPKE